MFYIAPYENKKLPLGNKRIEGCQISTAHPFIHFFYFGGTIYANHENLPQMS